MTRSSTPRHVRPSGRRAIEAAYHDVLLELSRLRHQRYDDELEIVRLGALVDLLSQQVAALSAQLAQTRADLQAVRSTPPQRDPSLEVLASQVADLRAVVASQQEALGALTTRLVDALDRALAVRPYPATSTGSAPQGGEQLPHPGAMSSPAASSGPSYDQSGTGPRADAHVLDVTAGSVHPGSDVDALDALDDETLLRLRLIRQSFGG